MRYPSASCPPGVDHLSDAGDALATFAISATRRVECHDMGEAAQYWGAPRWIVVDVEGDDETTVAEYHAPRVTAALAIGWAELYVSAELWRAAVAS